MARAADREQPSKIRAAMGEIFQALAVTFPLSLDEEAFRSPAHRERILGSLQRLASHAERLKTHGQDLNPSFDFLRRSLARDASEALNRFELGNYEWARFTLQQLAENCFACHSKLPSESQFALGKRFVDEARITELPPETQVKLQVATRQFATALQTYETMFRSPSFGAGEIFLMGAFEDYLKICIRVRNDFDRAVATLQAVRERPDTPVYLRDQIQDWTNTLKQLQERTGPGNELLRARDLVREAKLRKRFPGDRQGLVHFLVASSLLHRYVASDGHQPKQLGEAYYLLGATESHISRSASISETEFFLEMSIRLDPKSSVAQQAYAFLEEYTIWGYTGSAGVQLPPDVRVKLEELRRLIEEGSS
jgi:hypothetical protein